MGFAQSGVLFCAVGILVLRRRHFGQESTNYLDPLLHHRHFPSSDIGVACLELETAHLQSCEAGLYFHMQELMPRLG